MVYTYKDHAGEEHHYKVTPEKAFEDLSLDEYDYEGYEPRRRLRIIADPVEPKIKKEIKEEEKDAEDELTGPN